MNDIINPNSKVELNILADELKAIIVEHEFLARDMVIQCWHLVGKTLNEYLKDVDRGNRLELVQGIAERIGRSSRTLWYAMKFAQSYPDLSKLPSGKVITWNKVIKLLTSSTDKPHEHHWIEICTSCKERRITAGTYS